MSPPTISVVGTGAVARAVACAHARAGGSVVAVCSRSLPRAEEVAGGCGALATTSLRDTFRANAVIVAVSDRAVAALGGRLARLVSGSDAAETVFLHTSGVLAGSDMCTSPVRSGSLHPLQSFPQTNALPETGDRAAEALVGGRVPGTHWFHEGEGEDLARQLVTAWRGTFHSLAPGSKALYHAGAAILSNHTVALFATATQLFAAAGIGADEARAPLATLLAGTSANLAAMGSPAALTGPIARGDGETVARHMAALRDAAPELLASYVSVALVAVDVAIAKGSIDTAGAERLRATLNL